MPLNFRCDHRSKPADPLTPTLMTHPSEAADYPILSSLPAADIGSDENRTHGSAAFLSSILDTKGIQGASNNMIPYTRKVFNAPTTDKNNRMFLKIIFAQ